MKWKQAAEQADAKLSKVCQKERHVKIKIEQEEKKMSELKNNHTDAKKNLEEMEKKLAEYRSQISVIGKLHLKSQKAHITVQRQIEEKKIECNTILKECKVCEFLMKLKDLHISKDQL